MKIPSKEIMEIFPRLVHLCGCRIGGIIPFVMLPWFWKLGQCLVDIFLLWGGLRIRYDIEGERRRAFERVGHHDNTASAGLDISIAIKKS
jgi:hypothetical protein